MVDRVPEQLRKRTLAVRAFESTGMMVGFALVDGREVEKAIATLFARPDADYLHIHFAAPTRRGWTASREREQSSGIDAAVGVTGGRIELLFQLWRRATHAGNDRPAPLHILALPINGPIRRRVVAYRGHVADLIGELQDFRPPGPFRCLLHLQALAGVLRQ